MRDACGKAARITARIILSKRRLAAFFVFLRAADNFGAFRIQWETGAVMMR